MFENNKTNYLWWVLSLASALIIGFLIFKSAILVMALLIVAAAIIFFWSRLSWLYYITLFSILAGQLIRVPIMSDQSGAILVTDLILLFCIFIWIMRKIRYRQPIPSSPINRWIFIFIGFALISLFFSAYYLVSSELLRAGWYLARWVMYTCFFFISLDIINSKNELLRTIYSIIIIGVAVAILGIGQFILFPNFAAMAAKAGWDPHMYRVLSVFFDPNYTGGFLAVIITMILTIYLNIKNSRTRLWLLLAFIPTITAFVLTFSRSSYLALAIMLLVIFIFQSRKIALILFALIFIAGGVVLSSEKVMERIQQRIAGARKIDVTASARIESWNNAWSIISDQPLTGIGFNAYPQAQDRYGFVQNLKGHSIAGSDSSILNTWAMTGIFGLISYLLIYVGVMRQGLKLIKTKKGIMVGFGLGLFAALCGLLIHAQFVNGLYYPHYMLFFWVLAAIAFRSETVLQRKRGANSENR